MVARAAFVDTDCWHRQKCTNKVLIKTSNEPKSLSCSGPLAEDRYEPCQALVQIH